MAPGRSRHTTTPRPHTTQQQPTCSSSPVSSSLLLVSPIIPACRQRPCVLCVLRWGCGWANVRDSWLTLCAATMCVGHLLRCLCRVRRVDAQAQLAQREHERTRNKCARLHSQPVRRTHPERSCPDAGGVIDSPGLLAQMDVGVGASGAMAGAHLAPGQRSEQNPPDTPAKGLGYCFSHLYTHNTRQAGVATATAITTDCIHLRSPSRIAVCGTPAAPERTHCSLPTHNQLQQSRSRVLAAGTAKIHLCCCCVLCGSSFRRAGLSVCR